MALPLLFIEKPICSTWAGFHIHTWNSRFLASIVNPGHLNIGIDWGSESSIRNLGLLLSLIVYKLWYGQKSEKWQTVIRNGKHTNRTCCNSWDNSNIPQSAWVIFKLHHTAISSRPRSHSDTEEWEKQGAVMAYPVTDLLYPLRSKPAEAWLQCTVGLRRRQEPVAEAIAMVHRRRFVAKRRSSLNWGTVAPIFIQDIV